MTSEKMLKAGTAGGAEEMLLTFEVGKEIYGIETVHIDEIIGLQNITVMPQTRSDVKGLINLRGKIIPVIDLRLRLNMEPHEYDDRTGIIVVSYNGITNGLIVDRVSEVLPSSDVSVVSISMLNMNLSQSCIDRFGIFRDQIIMVLNCAHLMASDGLAEMEI